MENTYANFFSIIKANYNVLGKFKLFSLKIVFYFFSPLKPKLSLGGNSVNRKIFPKFELRQNVVKKEVMFKIFFLKFYFPTISLSQVIDPNFPTVIVMS